MAYNPPIHDPIVAEHHQRGQTDHEITRRMLDLGFPVSHLDVQAARRRLGLCANFSITRKEEERPIRERINPLREARFRFGLSFEERPDSLYLRGSPIDLMQLMQKIQLARLAAGEELVPNWPCPPK